MPRFDQAVDIVVKLLGEALGGSSAELVIVRDVTGSVTAVLPDDSLPDAQWSPVARELHEALGRYSPGLEQVLLRRSDLIDPADVLSSQDRVRLPDHPNAWMVDRLLTNQDWLRQPVVATPRIPTAAAFSIKGGVGRSTAFAVWAWYLARQGKRVLVVDLDLEAPGIGSILLGADDLPDYGLADWFVEALAGQADGELLEEIWAPSPLSADAPGSIDVIPAFGTKTRNYVAKLGRVYTPTMTDRGATQGFAHRLAALIDQAASRKEPPDVVLLDARAGLHDIGAATVTQLGAEVFLFARNEAQSWAAYERLFEHLRMARTVCWGMPDEDLRWRLKMVAAQLDPTEGALDRWVGGAYSCWLGFYDAETKDGEKEDGQSQEPSERAQTFERADEAAPHYPMPILFDSRLRGLNLVAPDERPDWSFIEATFGRFLKDATARLLETTGSEPQNEGGQ
jgi:Mrp family chromosome partitioning ATPase